MKKYSHFLTDISGYKCTITCFEVTSTGFINTRNQKTLHTLHSFMRKDLKRSVFMNNLNMLAWYGSYQIWLSREDPTFTSPSYLIPHIGDLPQWSPSQPSHLYLRLVDPPASLPSLPEQAPHPQLPWYGLLYSDFCSVGLTTCLGPEQSNVLTLYVVTNIYFFRGINFYLFMGDGTTSMDTLFIHCINTIM